MRMSPHKNAHTTRPSAVSREMGLGHGSGVGWRGMCGGMPAFSDLDLNGDGALTERAFYQARSQRIAERSQQGHQMRNLANAPAFSAIDRDGSGVVDPTDFASARAQHRRQMSAPASPLSATL